MPSIDLYPHQLSAYQELDNGKILTGGVGTGKSITSLAYFYTKECGGELRLNGQGSTKPPTRPRDIYVITTAKKRDDLDWEKEAARFTISTRRDLSISGIQLQVDSWNNIVKYVDVKDAFFILDEQRLVGSGAWVKAFLKIAKHNRWIMLSATPGDVWMDYYPVFQANGFYKNKTDFQDQHVVWARFSKFPKIDRYVSQGKLLRLRRQILVEMPFERHTKRHLVSTLVDYDEKLYDKVVKKKWHVFEDRPARDIGELFLVMRKLVNSHPSRLEKVKELSKKHPRLIIFYNHNHELDSLRTLQDSLKIPCSEWNGHKHQDIPEGDRWIYLVQYTAGAEGWNCITTDAMIFYSLNYSYKIWEQAQGRIDRLNTKYTDLYYYVLRSKATIDIAIMRAIRNKKSFNEKAYVKAAGMEK